jgi:hypothetical protein
VTPVLSGDVDTNTKDSESCFEAAAILMMHLTIGEIVLWPRRVVQAGGVVDHGSERHATVIPIYVDWCGVTQRISASRSVARARSALALGRRRGAAPNRARRNVAETRWAAPGYDLFRISRPQGARHRP